MPSSKIICEWGNICLTEDNQLHYKTEPNGLFFDHIGYIDKGRVIITTYYQFIAEDLLDLAKVLLIYQKSLL